MAKRRRKTQKTTKKNGRKQPHHMLTKAAWGFTIGFFILGLGLGLYFQQVQVFMLLGLWIGLVITMILRYKDTRK